MSRRTAESNRAILAAWNKEQELVQEGKGTREWTPQQQQDILEKGKAYGVGLSLCGRDFFEPNIKPFAECVIPFVCFVHVATSFIKIPHIGCLNSNKGEDEKQKKPEVLPVF